MPFKIKNLTEDTRQFVDKSSGRIILVEPGKEITHSHPPKPSSVWKVTESEEKSKKVIKTENKKVEDETQ